MIQAAGHPPGPFGDQHRLERAGPVARHPQAHRADARLHLFADRPITRITAVMTGPLMPFITQVRGQLGLQRPLQDRLDQLAEHRARTGQPQPPGRIPRPLGQRIQQPVIHQLPQRHRRQPSRGGISPVVMRTLSRKATRFRSGHHPCLDRLLACNGHDLCSPPVPVAIPTSHTVTLCHSLHTWGDTPGRC